MRFLLSPNVFQRCASLRGIDFVRFKYSKLPETMKFEPNLGSTVDKSEVNELPLSKAMLTKLEQLSALRFQSEEEIASVEEDIRLAQKVFEVKTEGVEPLYSIVEEVINCPLRDDTIVEPTSAARALQNAPHVVEDFIVVPQANIPQEANPLLEEHAKSLKKAVSESN
uniref:Glutamyl-tRNA(Gln) amidotransferase subunit C, mitochondrial n=1 Tax=Panagrellus redivivus TaxID=6233 RepID=A0A7E4VZN7_PANRE